MSKLALVLDKLDQKTINKEIITPCRIAQNSYKAEKPIPRKYHEFSRDCAGYFKHLMLAFLNITTTSMTFEMAYSEARRLLDQVYHGIGGMRYAFDKAQSQTFGYIKAVMTDAYINNMTNSYIHSVLRKYIDPYNYDDIKDVMSEYVREFKITGLTQGDFQHMIANYEVVFMSHVKRHNERDHDRKMGAISRL